MDNKVKSFIGVLIIIAFFILFSYIIQKNIDYFRGLIGNSLIGMAIYVAILIIATVVAPVNAVPLLPLASNLWGWFLTALLSIAGWTIGSLMAFSLARKYGVPLVRKIISLDKIEKFEKWIPQQNIFWGIVFLRMAVPADALSYVLGLFSRIRFGVYAIATLIGLSPMAFVFAYLGTLPVIYQITAFLFGLMIFLLGVLIALIIKSKKSKKHKSQ